MRLHELPTPCAVVDLDRVEANCARMQARAAGWGVRLRPHVKTHKCPELARLQVRDGFQGITVSTLAEAEAFAAAGFRDILYAVPVAPQKVPRAVALSRQVDALHLIVDSPAPLDVLSRACAAAGRPGSVFVEVDCGDGRTGVDPLSRGAVSLAARIHQDPHLTLTGVLTHGGQSYGVHGAEAIRAIAETERAVMAAFADRLRDEGLPVLVVSAGSTPGCVHAAGWAGVTELRPGNYVFFDQFQATIGSCAADAVALSVLATVVSSRPSRNQVVLDAGALALSKDPGARHVRRGASYGALFTADLGAPIAGTRLVSLSQEHGVVRTASPAVAEALPVGTRLRVLPNHACLVAGLHPELVVARGDAVVDRWRPVKGW